MSIKVYRRWSYYGAESLAPIKNTANKLGVAQRCMEKKMLDLSLRDKLPNADVRKRSGVADANVRKRNSNWNWEGHLARENDELEK